MSSLFTSVKAMQCKIYYFLFRYLSDYRKLLKWMNRSEIKINVN